MKKIVIYDSYFGNTQTIAEAIAKELECDSIKVQIFNEDVINNYDLVVLGSPTRKFGPTKEIKNLAKLIEGHGTKVALFDTRIDVKDELPKILLRMIKKKGYSNDTLEKILRKKHVPIVIYSGEFLVGDKEGPLKEGELEKASEFGLAILNILEK
jgi:flavodoxin I